MKPILSLGLSLGLLLYLYGLLMCFDLDPLGIGLFPGLVAGAGAVLLMVGFGMWAARKHARPV